MSFEIVLKWRFHFKDKKLVKTVAARWRDDAEFGRQLLNGANPTQIRRVTRFTDELKQVGSEVKLGQALESEINVSGSKVKPWRAR